MTVGFSVKKLLADLFHSFVQKGSTQETSEPQSAHEKASTDVSKDGFRSWLGPQQIAFLIALTVVFLSYLPNLISLEHTWSNDPNYTHGYLVIPIALIIFWTRSTTRKDESSSRASQAWAWGLLAAVSVLRVVLYERAYQWLETSTLIPTVACLIWTYGGLPLFKRAWPAIVFLVFLLPLPQTVNNMVSLPLQRLATLGSSFILQLTGLWVYAEGNVVNINTGQEVEKLEVATVCNGLSMLMSLSAVVIATITLIPMANWKRVALLASVVPIALFSNILRIVATGWCYYLFGGEHSRKLAHDWAGFLMMPLALGLVFLEMGLLSWLADEGGSSDDDPQLFLPLLSVRKT